MEILAFGSQDANNIWDSIQNKYWNICLEKSLRGCSVIWILARKETTIQAAPKKREKLKIGVKKATHANSLNLIQYLYVGDC